MQKKILIGLAGFLLTVIAVSAVYMAVNMHGMQRRHDFDDRGRMQNFHEQRPAIVLSDEQKKELEPLVAQLVDVHKQIAQKLVADGVLKQEDADKRIADMQKNMNERLKEGRLFIGGFMGGPGGPGKNERHPGDNCGWNQQPPAGPPAQ